MYQARAIISQDVQPTYYVAPAENVQRVLDHPKEFNVGMIGELVTETQLACNAAHECIRHAERKGRQFFTIIIDRRE